MKSACVWGIMNPGILSIGASTSRPFQETKKHSGMEVIIVVVLVLMLVGVAYAQWQRGVVRTVGPLTLDDDDKEQSTR
jgi:hypothetical protein